MISIFINEKNAQKHNNVYKALGEWWLNRNIMNDKKRHSRFKVRCFKTPNASYTEPLVEIPHATLNLKHMKRDNAMEIKRLTFLGDIYE